MTLTPLFAPQQTLEDKTETDGLKKYNRVRSIDILYISLLICVYHP
jgi:hypothetical protein